MHLWHRVQHARVQAGSRTVNHIFSYRNMPACLLETDSQQFGSVSRCSSTRPSPDWLPPWLGTGHLISPARSFPLCGAAIYSAQLQQAQKSFTLPCWVLPHKCSELVPRLKSCYQAMAAIGPSQPAPLSIPGLMQPHTSRP